MTLQPGKPYPLGATWDGLGTNFAVFSAHAQRIDLCLFDPSGRRELARTHLPECTDEVWHGYLPNAELGWFMAIGPMVHTIRKTGIASIRPQAAARSLCMPASSATCIGPMRCMVIAFNRRVPICRSTGAIVRQA